MSEGQEFGGYPSPPGSPWPRAWHYGVDFSDGSTRVIAVLIAGVTKYETRWVGPVDVTGESRQLLAEWAEAVLDLMGGYVHLLPASGDGLSNLREAVRASEELR